MTCSAGVSPAAYKAPLWLPGGHLQTIYAAVHAPRPRVSYKRERWETPDGDFVDVDWLDGVIASAPARGDPVAHVRASASALLRHGVPRNDTALSSRGGCGSRRGDRVAHGNPLVVLFHGLEGSSRSHYARALMAEVAAHGMNGAVVHFRGCSGEPNRLPRAYHSGDSDELDWILRRLRALHPDAALYITGVSLGGNVLLKWLGERAHDAANVVTAAAAICAPVDVQACGNALDRGLNLIYTRAFLATLKAKSLAKLEHHPGTCDAQRIRRAGTLRAFDDAVTAPLHGFRDTDDYWTRASSKPWLKHITVPTLILNALNDPFLPASALPAASDVSDAVTLELPAQGGHVGFVQGPYPGNLQWLPQRVLDFFRQTS